MTWFDYLVIGIVLLSMILGGFRGMVKEVFSLANLLLAFWVANRYGGDLVVYMDWASELSPAMKALLGCATAFFGVLVVGAILIALLSRILSAAGLGLADRGMGLVFGVGRGLAIVFILVIAAGFTSLPSKPFWQEAALSEHFVQFLVQSKPHLPEVVAKWILY
ncbi:MAG: CvpA family protein [Limnobacter sp.]|nr:CvpA family protein [Limnobacter sp.]